MNKIAYSGNDVHKEKIMIAVYLEKGNLPEIEKRIENDKAKVQKFYKRLKQKYPNIKACYEASSSGYVFYRWLKEIGVECEVIAPGLIPKKSSDRIKTDRRDAQKLGRLYRAGELTAVHVPEEEEEAVRSISRLREQLVRESGRSKQYILKFLRARGFIYRESNNWTQKHWSYLKGIRFDKEQEQYTLDSHIRLLEYKQIELEEATKKIEEIARSEKYKEPVQKLRNYRGIDTVTAMGVMSEIIDFKRFANAKSIMSYVGLIPGERSSGEVRKQGAITKCGNSRVRRLLIEAAWHYRHKPGITKPLQKRLKGQPVEEKQKSLKCQKRLHARMFHLLAKGKNKNKVTTAIARELIGFIWATMTNSEKNEKELVTV